MTTPKEYQETLQDRIQDLEGRLAAVVRQYFRALDAHDEWAVGHEAMCICSVLSFLLSTHLETEEEWDSEERWIDGLIDSRIAKRDTRSIFLTGRMVWGLSAYPGGEQWAEGFAAMLRADDDGLHSYRIYFCDLNQMEQELEFGAYPTVVALDETQSSDFESKNWKFVIEGGSSLAM